MKKIPVIIFAALFTLSACNTPKNTSATTTAGADAGNMELSGAWELDFVPNPSGTFEELYSGKKPNISFNEKEGTYSGHSSCNSFRGKLEKDKDAISFKGDMMMTKMACMGDGEKIFLENLKKINHYSISKDGNELTFIQGDIVLMHFHKMAQ
ncbi:META domain-containing protein [Taibaiella lutea]|nr:META domain-containing protein [Taibaiella lutea]